LVQEKAVSVGCAMSQYTNGPWKTSLFACNYARTNMINNLVYKRGQTASGCKTGKNPSFQGLCSAGEPINPNSFNIDSEFSYELEDNEIDDDIIELQDDVAEETSEMDNGKSRKIFLRLIANYLDYY
jgi:hypothetical protein